MTGKRLNYILFFVSAAFLFSGCGLFENGKAHDESGNIFGRWELDEIRYDNGETLKPAEDEPYWFELKEDSVFAEQEYHYSLEGQSFCNPCFGYFDFNEENQSINISFICERLICGIATEFSAAISTTYKYKFKNNALILTFEYPTDQISPSSGIILLNPKQ